MHGLAQVPAQNDRYVAFFNRVLKDEKYFQVFDTYLGHPVRKYTHKCQDDFAFSISADAKWLCSVENDRLTFQVVRMPENKSIKDQFKMQYKSGTLQNYGDACDKKQTFKDRIYRDLHVFHMYEEETDQKIVEKMSNGVTRKQNMQLMCLKYDKAVEEPFKLKNNREFLFM